MKFAKDITQNLKTQEVNKDTFMEDICAIT